MKDEEIEECIKQTFDVEFLTEKWEKEQYAAALIEAVKWGNKIKEEKKRIKLKSLVENYNTF